MHKQKDMEHPEIPSEKLLAKQLRQEINAMKLHNPDKAKEFEKLYFEKDDWHDIITKEPDLSEVKFYPGSDKGPLPEDDPENYTKWFVENQPRNLFSKYTKENNFKEFGIKQKNIFVTKSQTEHHESKTMPQWFYDMDVEYPL